MVFGLEQEDIQVSKGQGVQSAVEGVRSKRPQILGGSSDPRRP